MSATIIIHYLLTINLLTFVAYGHDKWKAENPDPKAQPRKIRTGKKHRKKRRKGKRPRHARHGLDGVGHDRRIDVGIGRAQRCAREYQRDDQRRRHIVCSKYYSLSQEGAPPDRVCRFISIKEQFTTRHRARFPNTKNAHWYVICHCHGPD